MPRWSMCSTTVPPGQPRNPPLIDRRYRNLAPATGFNAPTEIVTLILGNLSYPGKPARRSARDRRIVRLTTVSSSRSATPKIPPREGHGPQD
jgi:hypothetical protein